MVRVIEAGGRSYRVDRGVFDPARHLSGVAFAGALPSFIRPGMRVVEIGTGCGILAAAAADAGAAVVATDRSRRAVACARRNTTDLDVEVRHGDLFEPVRDERFELVICNPPYEVGRSVRQTLRSPDFLRRFAATVAAREEPVLLGFPADEHEDLRRAGFELTCVRRITTSGDDLGLFSNQA